MMLDAEGQGSYVGRDLNTHNLRKPGLLVWNWYGEGGDRIFIDGEKWLPFLRGTEDYFNTAFCLEEEYNAPYHGMVLNGKGRNWVAYYRYHMLALVMFGKSIKVTIGMGRSTIEAVIFRRQHIGIRRSPQEIYLLPVTGRMMTKWRDWSFRTGAAQDTGHKFWVEYMHRMAIQPFWFGRQKNGSKDGTIIFAGTFAILRYKTACFHSLHICFVP